MHQSYTQFIQEKKCSVLKLGTYKGESFRGIIQVVNGRCKKGVAFMPKVVYKGYVTVGGASPYTYCIEYSPPGKSEPSVLF